MLSITTGAVCKEYYCSKFWRGSAFSLGSLGFTTGLFMSQHWIVCHMYSYLCELILVIAISILFQWPVWQQQKPRLASPHSACFCCPCPCVITARHVSSALARSVLLSAQKTHLCAWAAIPAIRGKTLTGYLSCTPLEVLHLDDSRIVAAVWW